MLNSRETATAVIIAVALVAVLLYEPSRRRVPSVFRAAFHWRLGVLWAVYVGYSVLVVWVASRLNAWDASMLKDTVLVVVGTGLPLLFSANKMRDGPEFVSSTVRRTIGWSAIIGLYVNLAAFSFWVELPLQLVVIAAGAGDAVATRMPDSRAVRRLFRAVMTVAGVAVLWHTTSVVIGWTRQEWVATGRVAAMAVWFVVALLPLVYTVAYWMRCGQISCFLRVQNPGNRRPPLRVRFAMVMGLRGSVRLAHAFAGRWYGRVGRMHGYGETVEAMGSFRSTTGRSAAEADGGRGSGEVRV